MTPLERRDRQRARKIVASQDGHVALIAKALKEEREEAFFAAFHAMTEQEDEAFYDLFSKEAQKAGAMTEQKTPAKRATCGCRDREDIPHAVNCPHRPATDEEIEDLRRCRIEAMPIHILSLIARIDAYREKIAALEAEREKGTNG